MPRIVYLLGVAMLVVGGGFLLTDRLLNPPGVTEGNARRLRVGMTARRVETIFGPPTFCEYVRKSGETSVQLEERWDCIGCGRRIWWGWRTAAFTIDVYFDPAGRVWMAFACLTTRSGNRVTVVELSE